MRDTQAAKAELAPVSQPDDILFDRIGSFLNAQGLSPDPAHYAFAFAALSAPEQPLGQAVARLSAQGIRLTRHDIERLGGRVIEGPPVVWPRHADATAGGDVAGDRTAPDPEVDTAMALVVETQQQVDGFAEIVRTMQAETHGFGRELARSAASITQLAEIDEIVGTLAAVLRRLD